MHFRKEQRFLQFQEIQMILSSTIHVSRAAALQLKLFDVQAFRIR